MCTAKGRWQLHNTHSYTYFLDDSLALRLKGVAETYDIILYQYFKQNRFGLSKFNSYVDAWS